MRAFAALLFLSYVAAQSGREMYLPQKSISGIVVDATGQPLPNVTIEYAGKTVPTTAQDGRFHVDTRSLALVFRKPGYRSHFLRTDNADNLRVVMQVAEPKPAPLCRASQRCESLQGWPASFCFPMPKGVDAGRQGNDADYGVRAYTVNILGGRKGIRHAAGPMWGPGLPLSSDIQASVEYDEQDYALGEDRIVDARGKTADGKYWRQLGHAFESAEYRDVDEQTARLLDPVLDGFCLIPRKN